LDERGYLIDADIAVKLQLSRILASGIIERDRTVDILAARYRENKVIHLRLLRRQEFHENILRRQALRLFKPLLDIAYVQDIALANLNRSSYRGGSS